MILLQADGMECVQKNIVKGCPLYSHHTHVHFPKMLGRKETIHLYILTYKYNVVSYISNDG